VSLAERWMDAGEMPALAALRARGARVLLDHGPAQRTGLAWEHVAAGQGPEQSGRHGAVEFDPESYRVWQEGAQQPAFFAGLDARTVVFDAPYLDLARAGNTRGIVAWGAHDPGIEPDARPRELLAELEGRFGAYPAARWTYATPWPSAGDCRRMGQALASALDLRARAARWLLRERCPDWDLALVVAGELHSAIEGLWHGVDPAHPLHAHPSAGAAGAGILDVHRALDRFVGELVSLADDAHVVAFAMGGMGENRSDVPSMVLLPELLHRHAFGRAWLEVPDAWAAAPGGVPVLGEDESWTDAVHAGLPARARGSSFAERVRGWLRRGSETGTGPAGTARAPRSLAWQPATRYQALWPRMPAFALPSFYDGRVRVNLRGRERRGTVEPSDYTRVCDEIEELVRTCRDPRTGEGVVEDVERPTPRDPRELGRSDCDLCIVWRGTPLALEHARHGTIGPVPFRRTGGHTGPHGVAYIALADGHTGPHVRRAGGERGVRPALDVVPTLVDLLGLASDGPGSSLLSPGGPSSAEAATSR